MKTYNNDSGNPAFRVNNLTCINLQTQSFPKNCNENEKLWLRNNLPCLKTTLEVQFWEQCSVCSDNNFFAQMVQLLYSPCAITTHIVNVAISDGNRTEWIPIRSATILVINKIGRARRGSPICLITSMITDRIGQYEVLLPINHNHYQFSRKQCIPSFFLKKNFQHQILAESLFRVTNSSILENHQFGRVSGCCYGYCDKLCDWWIELSALNVIG